MPLLLLPWRAALLWWLSVAPWAGPLEARVSGDLRGYAAAGLLFFALLAALVVRRIETAGKRDPIALSLIAGAACSLVAAAVLPRGTVGLSIATLVVAPFVWAALWLGGRRWLPGSRAPVAFLVCAAAISWVLGGGRALSRERQWREAVDASPRWTVAHHALLSLAEGRGAPERERAVLAEACLAQCPTDARCARYVAVAKERAGDCVLALDAARVALRANANDRALLALASRCVRLGTRTDDETLALARRALSAAPADESARVTVATVLERRGDTAGALAVLRDGPPLQGADAVLLLARTALAARDEVVARAALERRLASASEDVEARYLLGGIEHREGHFNRARENYLRALAADPTHFFARYNLARLLLSAGVLQEALRHAQRLLEQNARDPRVRDLARDIQGQIAASEAAVAGPSDGGVSRDQ
jgi:Flp pilus assembly protein TadD